MEKKMNKFLTKASALVFAFLCVSNVFSATAATELSAITLGEDIIDAAPPAVMPFKQCILNFSDPLDTAKKIGVFLFNEKFGGGKLELIDIAYLTFEGIAEGARKNPGKFGEFGKYFNNENAVYGAFGKVLGSFNIAKSDLSTLATLEGCQTFVRGTILEGFPLLFDKIPDEAGLPHLSADIQRGIVEMLASPKDPFVRWFAGILNTSYTSSAVVADQISAGFKEIEDFTVGCGCFPCFSGKKKR